MKTIPLITVCFAMALSSCGENISRRDVAKDYLASMSQADRADYEVARLRLELEAKPDAGKAGLLLIDLETAMKDLEKADAAHDDAWSQWQDVKTGDPDFSGALANYKAALIRERVAALYRNDDEYRRLLSLELAAVLREFGG